MADSFLEEVISYYRKALELDPQSSEIKAQLGRVLARNGDFDEAFSLHGLHQIDTKDIHLNQEDIVCFSVVRNEYRRLPYFLEHYRSNGVSKFFFVDNDSTDQTREYLLEQSDVYLWHTNASFNYAGFGSLWFEALLKKYAQNHWCLYLDADEFLYYENCETQNLVELCKELDRQGKRAFTGVLLDMYSNTPITETVYTPGSNPLDICPFFDKNFYHNKIENSGPCKNQTHYLGGVRKRVFKEKWGEMYWLNKAPLLKDTGDLYLFPGQHWTSCPKDEVAYGTGCLFHFKYLSFFKDYVEESLARNEHAADALPR